MLKLIGGIVLVAGVALGIAVGTGVVDFQTQANLTPKGEAKVQELRNEAANAIRGGAGAVAGQVEKK